MARSAPRVTRRARVSPLVPAASSGGDSKSRVSDAAGVAATIVAPTPRPRPTPPRLREAALPRR